MKWALFPYYIIFVRSFLSGDDKKLHSLQLAISVNVDEYDAIKVINH